MSSNKFSRFFLLEQGKHQAGAPQGVLPPRQKGSHLPTQPMIGIPLPVQQGPQGPLLLADAVGIWAIERMGARSLLLPLWPFPPQEQAHHVLWELVAVIDGLFLPARESSHSPLLSQEDQQQPQRWEGTWEEALAQLATAVGMPVLALADGAWTWNKALGGKSQDEAPPGPPHAPLTAPQDWERRTIRVRAHSALASALQATVDLRDSEHKPWELPFMSQPNVKPLAPGLRPCAQVADGTVVAFERSDTVFGLGVIGRLDWGLEHVLSRAVFTAFFQACQSFDRSRQQHTGWYAARDATCAAVAALVKRQQPLLPALAALQQQQRQPVRPLAPQPSLTDEPMEQQRIRQRKGLPTKEELNRIRRQRWKMDKR